MKFGKTFESHLTIEWRQQYMDYTTLKEMIREGVANAPSPEEATNYALNVYYLHFEERFFTACHNEFTRVNNFFLEKMAEARRKHATLKLQLMAMAATRAPLNPSSSTYSIASHRDPAVHGARKLMTPRQLRVAYSEFYLSLVLLQNFQTLNTTGFRKICKKYDKYMKSKQGRKWLDNTVLTAEFAYRLPLERIIVEVENLYTEHLANGNRALAMNKLRVPPLGGHTKPGLVFRAALALGMFVMLAAVTLVSYMKNSPAHDHLQLFSRMYRGPFTWVIFNFYMAANVAGWQAAGVNHVLIFEMDPRHHLQPATFLEIACTFGILWTLSILGFVFYKNLHVSDPFVFPLALTLIQIALLINPLPIMNWPARRWTIRLVGRVLTAPFHYVGFADFWLGDQLNSLVICVADYYYIVRFFALCWLRETDPHECLREDIFVPICRCLPAWFRLAQCLRRFRDSGSKSISYLINAGKYSTTFFVVFFQWMRGYTEDGYSDTFKNPYTWCLLISYVVSTIYCYIWDVFKDFGIFRIWKGEHLFLREKLVYPQSFYYFAIIENLILRFFWAAEFALLHYNLITPYNVKTFSSNLEITRRFIWNYLRLENEHLYNCGHFRAHRDIYLASLNPNQERMLEAMMDDEDGEGVHHKPKEEERARLGKEYF